MEFFATSAKRPGAEVHKGCIRSLSTSYALGTDAKPPLVVSGKRLPARLQGDEEQGGDEAPGGSFGDMSQSFPRSESTMSQPSTAGAAGELSPSLATETQAGFGPTRPEGPSVESQDHEFLSRMQLQISLTNRKALEEPAQYCAGEGEDTSFCNVLREFAATLRASTDLECVPRRSAPAISDVKKSKKARTSLLGVERKVLQRNARPQSFSEIPTQEEVKAHEERVAQEYTEQAKRAQELGQQKLEEVGRTADIQAITETAELVYRTQAVLQAYILSTTAKITLHNLKAKILAASSQLIVSLADMYNFLLSSLSGPLSIAWHFIDLVLEIAATALNQMSADREAADTYLKQAFLKLTDLDALVRNSARRKAEITTNLDKPVNEVDNQVKTESDSRVYAALEVPLQSDIIDRVLYAINSNASGSVRVSTSIIEGAQGAAVAAPSLPPHPGYVFRFGPGGPSQMPGAGAATRGGPGGATFPGGAPAGAIFTGPSGSGGPAEVPPGVTITREEGAEYPRGKMPGGRPGVVSPGVQITYEKGPAYPSGGLGETRVTAPGAPEHPGGAPAGVTLAGEGRPTAPGGVPSVTYTEAARKASAGKGAEFGVPVMVRVGGAGGGPTEVPTGLDEAEALARQHEQDGVNELGQRLARGATQFHTAPADYAMTQRGTNADICQTDVMLVPPTDEDKDRGTPPRDLGTRAARAVDSLVAHPIQEVKRPMVCLFSNQADIENHVKQIWEVEKSKIASENAPAPSFNTLVSTGCTSASDDLRRQFWEAWEDRGLFSAISGEAVLNERLKKRLDILVQQGIMPFMVQELDKSVGGSLNATLANNLHEGPARTFGFLDICDRACYQKPESRRGDVLASFIFSGDHTLMVLEAVLKRVIGYAIAYFNLSAAASQTQPTMYSGDGTTLRDTLDNSLSLFGSYATIQKGQKDPFQPSMTRSMLDSLATMARALYAAAEGFKPGSSRKAPVKSTALAVIFAKLWYESTPGLTVEGQRLKPFGCAVVSAGLQIAFFLHTIAGEYKASLLKRMGAAIKSFFVSIFKRSAKVALPSSWAVVEQRAMRQQKVNLAQYQGVLTVISQLSGMFRKRFLTNLYSPAEPVALKAFYVAVQALVGLWMNPFNQVFDLASPGIKSAKKLLYYYTFFHPQGPSFVAKKIIMEGCAEFGTSISLGVVVDVKDGSRKTTTDVNLYLTKKPIRLGRESALTSSLNKLMATYVDPMTIVTAAMDLAVRCRGVLQSPRGREQPGGGQTNAAGSSEPEVPLHAEKLANESTPTSEASFAQLGEGVTFKKTAASVSQPEAIKKTVPPQVLQQVLSSKLFVDMWCQHYKENLLAKMAAFTPTKEASGIQTQFDAALEALSEISISTREEASSWVISFKCLWMSGNNNQEGMQAERAAMTNYAISSGGLRKRLARGAAKIKALLKTKLQSIIRSKPTRPSTSPFGLLHSGTEVWTGEAYFWP